MPAAQVPFKLTSTRNDYIHALVLYFDVLFSRCHKPLSINTSPKYALHAPPWRPTWGP